MLHVMIGRGRLSDFRLENSSVSRVHAVLKSQGDLLRLEDRGSRNGTYVRKGQVWQRIDAADVDKTDRLRFGEQEVTVTEILKSTRKRPKIGGGKSSDKKSTKAGPRPKIGKKPGLSAGSGAGGQDVPLKKFVKPRRNPVTGDIEEGG